MSSSTTAQALWKRTYSVPEVAAVLGISRGSAYSAIASGEIPSVRVGSRLLVPRARLAEMLGETAEGGERIEQPISPAAYFERRTVRAPYPGART